MSRARVTVRLVDVDRSIERFIRKFPVETRALCAGAVRRASGRVLRRMHTKVEVGPDQPHLRDDLDMDVRGLLGRIGILEGAAGKPSAPGSETTQGEVALLNEYDPNRQPFMGNSLRAEATQFALDVSESLRRAVRSVSGIR